MKISQENKMPRHAGHFYFRHFHLVLFGVHCDHVSVVLMMLNILCD